MNDIKINDSLSLTNDDISFHPLFSSGPGGQNINKNMTAIQLRFDILRCHRLPEDVQQRLITLAGSRVNRDNELVITARRHRSQERNKREAVERLVHFIQRAAEKPKPRLKKRRSVADNQARLDQKKRRGDRKSMRRRVDY
ncbi:MAG: alternative ribosome rescue aminoacyl-tRNA hydrolase ArfB [Gammaproteobacteria bacterium]|nr:alternative ribosome rescue aminoacyl-tRNA hydrolase ArfB [Gammaproteobacteria bacterium]MDH5800131.1 alternative ribosome rescue aminoacyl-tRNA hydrolase ArfB [Gammaproteobacteria bacterium]